jgi:hypothetical protein
MLLSTIFEQMSRPRLHVRDAVKLVVADLDSFFEMTPAHALSTATRRVRALTPEALGRLRRRAFGTIPNNAPDAIRFLARRFREHKEQLDELESIESFSSSDSETATTLSVSSSDSDRTIPIDLRRF